MAAVNDDERWIRAKDVVGSREIASRLGLAHPESVHSLRRRDPSFPAPFKELAAGAMLWSWSDIEEWARRTGRL